MRDVNQQVSSGSKTTFCVHAREELTVAAGGLLACTEPASVCWRRSSVARKRYENPLLAIHLSRSA